MWERGEGKRNMVEPRNMFHIFMEIQEKQCSLAAASVP